MHAHFPPPAPHPAGPASSFARMPAIGMPACTLESALRLLLRARNSHGALRGRIRALARADIAALRGAV